MWAYPNKIYTQNNIARRFQLEHEIVIFQQDSLNSWILFSFQEYFITGQIVVIKLQNKISLLSRLEILFT